MRKRLLIICSMFLILSCCDKYEKLIEKLGYTYDSAQDIYVSKVNSWQRKMGYSYLIDYISTPVGMVIECEPVDFISNGRSYMIELWKGQYDLSTGAEIGIYTKTDPGSKTWKCGGNSEMLEMSYSLKKTVHEVFNRKGTHWWLTGFKPGEFANPEELTMDISINFNNHPEWKDPFKNRLVALGYDDREIIVNENTVKFVFNIPKTRQPEPLVRYKTQYQESNKKFVDEYNKAKVEAHVTDSSPCSIEKIVEKSPDLILHIFKQNP